jgi:bifunctional DNA-binding transcriptional regulator/antitoxin component of YhaV-PrlF toxin-antitoxin module
MIDMQKQVVTISPKFQVVIPQALREQYGIVPGQKMAWVDFGHDLRLMEIKPPEAYRGIARGIANTDIPNDPEL